MDRTKFLAWGTAIYLPLLLVVFVLAGWPWTPWLTTATILLTSLAIYALRQRWHRRRQDDLRLLTGYIQRDCVTWWRFEHDWIGHTVRLKEDIRNSKEPVGLQLYVRAGTLGKIVALRRSFDAPFEVLFPGFKLKVAVRLEKLDLNPVSDLSEEYDAA